DRSIDGLRAALAVAAEEMGRDLKSVLGEADMLIFGTTRATNAIVTRKTAMTAFLTTEGFPDILVLKEGGKFDPHDFSQAFPEPYIPRRHTFEVRERIDAEGGIVTPLDVPRTRDLLKQIGKKGLEAIAVCLIWSIANPAHELEIGKLIEEILPDVPFTLSHALIPILREYRRASTTAIDASLKPLMRSYLTEMEADLRAEGFKGELLISTSIGGCMHVSEIADRPIHTVKSGPAMAPLAGRVYAEKERLGNNLIVCDAGGTTFDVGLVRDGALVYTRETWLGRQWVGDLVSMSTVDVRSVGAGGGSIAWIDAGGLLHVGPDSAGASPGPACYGLGGDRPTVTDAAVVLGYIDPEYFNGGRIKLDVTAARQVMERLAQQMDRSVDDTAFGILLITNELMIKAIREITVVEGIDPRESTIVAGGGAAGLNIFSIARELECKRVLLPETASALSACGIQYADIIAEHSESFVTTSAEFDLAGVGEALRRIRAKLQSFEARLNQATGKHHSYAFGVEARYRFQVWDLETPLPRSSIDTREDVCRLVEEFHRIHERVFAIRDDDSIVEFLNWKGRVTVHLDRPPPMLATRSSKQSKPRSTRPAYFGAGKRLATPILRDSDIRTGLTIAGPAIVEMPTTTIVVYPGMTVKYSPSGNFVLEN
ncbi:MAG: hydantoinase/oxoprolinase family protein, partial [Steroidobacteraceae bacterium]